MTTVLLVDLAALYWPSYHVSGADDADSAARRTVGRVHQFARAYEHVAVCLDSARTWRHDRLPTYKANRAAKPEEARAGLRNAIVRLTEDGFPMLRADGFEADDVIATLLSRHVISAGADVLIATCDKDLMQLVDDARRVALLYTRDDGPQIWREEQVRAKFACVDAKTERRHEIGVAQVGDWIALVGDTSDNIPGVPGVGEKTATKLLARFGSIAKLLEAVDPAQLERKLAWELRASNGEDPAELGPKPDCAEDVSPALRAKLWASVDKLSLAVELVTLRTDVPLDPAELARVFKPREERRRTKIDLDGPDDPMSDGPIPEEEYDDMSDQDQPPPPDANAPRAANDNPVPTAETPKAEPSQPRTEPATPEAPAPPEVTFDGELQPRPPTQQQHAITTTTHEVPWEMTLEPTGLGQTMKVSEALWNSRLFGHLGSKYGVFAAAMLARSHGISLAKIVMPGVLHSINGRIAMSAQVMLGLVLRSPFCAYFELVESTREKATFRTKRTTKGAKEILYTFDIEEARAMKLFRPGSKWETAPRTMLRWRCVTELARAVYPEVVLGLYSPEELEDAAREREEVGNG